MYCVFVFDLLCLVPCPGRGLVCLDYLTNHTDWNLHDLGTDTQVGYKLDTSFALLFMFGCCCPLPFFRSFLVSHIFLGFAVAICRNVITIIKINK